MVTMVFDKTYLKDILATLPADRTPEWGTMTPQHMVEHLGFAVQLSNGKRTHALITPEEKVERAKARMLSEEWQMPVNFKAGFLPEEGLLPLKFDSLDDAIAALMTEIDDFYQYYRETPEKTTIHPYFGSLNHAEWEINHHKHFQHHLKQFGLL